MSDLKTEIPKELGIEIGGPGRAYFDDVIVDNLFDADYQQVLGYGTAGISAFGGVRARF